VCLLHMQRNRSAASAYVGKSKMRKAVAGPVPEPGPAGPQWKTHGTAGNYRGILEGGLNPLPLPHIMCVAQHAALDRWIEGLLRCCAQTDRL
jgi:hypothetical protein